MTNDSPKFLRRDEAAAHVRKRWCNLAPAACLPSSLCAVVVRCTELQAAFRFIPNAIWTLGLKAASVSRGA